MHGAFGGEVLEVARAVQQQGSFDGTLEVAGTRQGCRCGVLRTPPSSHKAFWQRPLKATKLSPPSTTSAHWNTE